MKRTALRAAITLALLSWAAVGAPQSSGPILLRLGTTVPDGSLWHQALRRVAAEWRQLTDRRVTLRVFAGTQGDESEIVRKLREGELDAAWLTASGLTTLDDAFTVFALPMFYASYEELAHVAAALESTLAARLAVRGFVLLDWSYAGWVHVFAREPVQSLADLESRRIAAAPDSKRLTRWYERNGFQPVPAPLAEIQPRLQAGRIDAVPATPLTALVFTWYRAAPHMLETGLGPLVGATVVAARAWSAITAQDRDALIATARRAAVRARGEAVSQDRLALAEMRKRGLMVTRLASPAEQAVWARAGERLAASMRGAMVPEDVYDIAYRARAAFRGR